MGMRIHSVTKVRKYGNCINSEITDKVLVVFRSSETGSVTENDLNGEIERWELQQIISETEDEELKKALELLESESDKESDYVCFSMF